MIQLAQATLRQSITMATNRQCAFGMGCFWAPQKRFSSLPGVQSSSVGYAGGLNTSPSYSSVCQGDGHIETVSVEYNDDEISYAALLDVFFDRDVQEFASGKGQYSNVIWVKNEAERTAAEERKQQLTEAGDAKAEMFSIRELTNYYVAETYHLNYLQKQTPRTIMLVV